MFFFFFLVTWVQNPQNTFGDLAEILKQLDRHSFVRLQEDTAAKAINGMLKTLDPHSSYYDRAEFSEIMASQLGSFTGIGIRVLKNHSHLYISEVKPNSPAKRAGLAWGDRITSVNGQRTTLENIDLLVDQIRGPIDEPLFLSIKTLQGERRELNLKRAEIQNTNMLQAFVFPLTAFEARTGYIKLNEFGETSGSEIQEQLHTMLQDGLDYLILDLRRNPGGLLPQATKVAGLFLPGRSLVVSTQSRNALESQQYFTSQDPPMYRGPLAVLIDQHTASAAEIVAGALQDHDRAIILGSQSWGKGLVQSVFSIPPGETGLALTTARYFTPLGRDIQGQFEDIYDYIQPDSGDTFFFKTKQAMDQFVTTRSGRKLYYTRGICPDVFYHDQTMVLAHHLSTVGFTLPLFLISHPQKDLMDFRSFFKAYREFFLYHNHFEIPITMDHKEAVFLYREYVYYLHQFVLEKPLDGEIMLDDPLIQLALSLWNESYAMSQACFENRPLPDQTMKHFMRTSRAFRTQPSIQPIIKPIAPNSSTGGHLN